MIMRRGERAGIVIETIILLIGLVLLAKATMLGTGMYRFIHRAEPTDGVVTGVSNHGFTLSVQIAAGDESYIFLQDGLFFGYQIGQQVPVLYDPTDPHQAAVNDFAAIWFDTVTHALAGLLLAAFGFHMRTARSV